MPTESPRRKRFLFVDDDPEFVAMERDVFGDMAHGTWDIATAGNHSQALAQLARQAVDVVVLDFNMPVMDGLQFLRLLRRTHPGQQVVMFSGRADEETRKVCLENGAALFLQKLLTPQGFEGVFTALDALAEAAPQAGFRGMMRQVGLQDVLQMECLVRKSSVLEIFTNKSHGRIFIKDGNIIHADCGTLEGELALYSLLALSGGEFNLRPFSEPPRATISGHYEFLLMEAARLRDENTQFFDRETTEAAAVAAVEPAPERVDRVAPTPAAPARIEQVVLCSGAGEVLYEQGNPSLERSLALLAQVEAQAVQLSGLVPTGRFDRLELVGPSGRAVCQIQPHMRLLVRTTSGDAALL